MTILGVATDPRIPVVQEAVAYWNNELARLTIPVRLDSPVVRNKPVSDEILRSASGEVVLGRGPAITQLRARVDSVPGDILIALADTDLISFGLTWTSRNRGFVAVRRADIPPLSLPNTLRNVVAHELGHVLGLAHNRDSTTLMCGRPAACRPAAFMSERPRFFPLTADDENRMRKRWQ